MDGSGWGFFPSRFKVGPELWEDRNQPGRVAGVVFGLWGWDGDSGLFPIHVLPCQGECLAGCPDATEPGQGDDQPPLGRIAGIQQTLGV